MSLDGVVDIEERYNKYKKKWRKNTRDRHRDETPSEVARFHSDRSIP